MIKYDHSVACISIADAEWIFNPSSASHNVIICDDRTWKNGGQGNGEARCAAERAWPSIVVADAIPTWKKMMRSQSG